MDKFSQVIITSTKNYIQDLEYIAKDDQKLLNDLYQLFILNNMIDWSCTYDVDESCKTILNKWIEKIINSNPNIPNIPYTDEYYSNVNTPQTLNTWRSLSHDLSTVKYLIVAYTLSQGSTSSNSGTIVAYNEVFTTDLFKNELPPTTDEVVIMHGDENITCNSYDEITGRVTIEHVLNDLKIIVL